MGHAEDTEVEAIMYKEHAEPFLGFSADDYARMDSERQLGIISSLVNREYIFEVTGKIVKGNKVISVSKAHLAANKRARVESDKWQLVHILYN